MKRNRYLIPLGALMAVLALGAVVMLVRANADDMLHQSVRLLADAQEGYAAGDVWLETPEKSASGEFQIWVRRNVGPEGRPAFRVEMLKGDAEEPAVAVSNGFEVWVWNPEKDTLYVGTHEELKAKKAELKEEFDHGDFEQPPYSESESDMPQTVEEAVDKLLENVDAERFGSEDVEGEPAEIVRLVPKPDEMPEEFRAAGGLFFVSLRASDYAPLAVEYAEGAMGSGKVTLSELVLAGEDDLLLEGAIDDEIFTFEIPAEAEVVRLADLQMFEPMTAEEVANTSVLMPAELPAGARLDGITEVRGAIVQRYRLPDGENFTIAQGPESAADTPGDNGEPVAVRGVEGLLFIDEDGQRTLLTWMENGARIWVAGDVTPSEAQAIAESLE